MQKKEKENRPTFGAAALSPQRLDVPLGRRKTFQDKAAERASVQGLRLQFPPGGQTHLKNVTAAAGVEPATDQRLLTAEP